MYFSKSEEKEKKWIKKGGWFKIESFNYKKSIIEQIKR
jgi:hypothetical protein